MDTCPFIQVLEYQSNQLQPYLIRDSFRSLARLSNFTLLVLAQLLRNLYEKSLQCRVECGRAARGAPWPWAVRMAEPEPAAAAALPWTAETVSVASKLQLVEFFQTNCAADFIQRHKLKGQLKSVVKGAKVSALSCPFSVGQLNTQRHTEGATTWARVL